MELETKKKHPIDQRCAEVGISRRELCRQSGISARTMECWCSGYRKSPDVYKLWVVAKTLRCHIEDLLEPERIADHSSEAANR